jgi:hypothetical protein
MVAPRCDWLAAAKIKNTKRATLIITFLEVEEQEAKKKNCHSCLIKLSSDRVTFLVQNSKWVI